MVTQFPQETHVAQAYLQPLDLAPGENIPWDTGTSGQSAAQSGVADNVGAIAFQYWPESVQDSRSSEWNPKNIPGGSHPIYQWTHGGERRLSFTAVFTTDTSPDESVLQSQDAAADLPSGADARSPYELMENRALLSGVDFGKRDVDLRAVVLWLRWFTYPTYGTGEDIRAYEPAKCLLVLPRTMLGHSGVDYLVCVMTQCDVTYEAWFPTGFPRIIEVALEFAEVIQEGARVAFHDRRDMRFAGAVSTFLSTKRISRG
jgi:hypothetical protein